VLLDRGGLALDAHVGDLGCTLAEELLRPTRIYVKPVLELLDQGLAVRALAHITGDGLFNLVRTRKPVGFDIDYWPEPPPIFQLVQRVGSVPDEEMFRAFNMGIGFALVVAPEAVDRVRSSLARADLKAHVLGRATDDPARTVRFTPRSLVGRDGSFVRA